MKPAELVRMYEHQREEIEIENKALRREVKALGEALVQKEKQISERQQLNRSLKRADSVKDEVLSWNKKKLLKQM